MEVGRIPNRLKKYRRLAGYSQKEVSAKLGLRNGCYISRWEKGLGYPSIPALFKLSGLYHTHPIHLYPELWQSIKRELLSE